MPHQGEATVSNPSCNPDMSMYAAIALVAKFYGSGTGILPSTGGDQVINPISDAKLADLSRPKVVWGAAT